MKKATLLLLLAVTMNHGLSFSQSIPPQPAIQKNNAAIPYSWDNVTIGGGGYVTGIVIHPTHPNRIFIRTDVGGAYHWDNAKQRWVQLLDGMPGDEVDGIALDAHKPDRVYLTLNDGVYRSDNIGQSWTKVMTATYNGNGNLRWTGECLAVDPLTSSVIYAGTRADGLYRSVNEGASWSKIDGVPNGTNGVRSVVIDPASAIGGRSAKVYAGIPGGGVYESIDGGTTFTAIPGAPPSPNRMALADGRLYVTHSNGVAVWNGTAWTDLTPANGKGKNYCGLAIEASDHSKIAVSQRYSVFNNPLYRSSDGGTTWQQMNTDALPINKTAEAAWWPVSWFSSATSSLVFDPLHHGDLYYTDWFGIWHSSNVWATGPVNWSTREKGHEELVILTLVAPPAGPAFYSGAADVFGFSHDDISKAPASRLYNTHEGFSIAYCESAPANIAVLGSLAHDGKGTILATSADYGANWITRALPEGVKLGRVAISAANPDKMVYVAGGTNGGVYYTTNRGASWTAATGAPAGSVQGDAIWSKDFVIAADCVDGDRFYIYKSGFLYATTNGGASWTRQNTIALPETDNYIYVASRPGTAGEIWVSLNSNGLYRTINGGQTFTKISALTASTAFSIGAPAPGTKTPAIYSYGTSAGVKAMYRSNDSGMSWDRLDAGLQSFPSGIKVIAADRKVYGKIYAGTGGRGVLYFQQLPGVPKPTHNRKH